MISSQVKPGVRIRVTSPMFRGKAGTIKGGELRGDRFDWISVLLDDETEPMAFMPQELVQVLV